MANLRLLYDNVADAATLVASSTSGSLVAANMQKNEKAAVWRSAATTATITATWSEAQAIDSLALGITNLTSLATVTLNLYAEVADASPVGTYTSSAVGSLALDELQWGIDALGMNWAQQAGVAVQPQVWCDTGAVAKKVEVVIDDSQNPAGYIEISRIALGMRHEMDINPQYGAKLRRVDQSKTSRAESGDLRVELQGMYRALDLNFSYIEPSDVSRLARLAAYGKGGVVVVSMAPTDLSLLHPAYSFFAVPVGNHEMSWQSFSSWSSDLTLEEI